MHQAMLGLQHIHEQGLVHRDLNPNNLMLVGGQANTTLAATVKILDIGMGRTLFDESAKEPGATPQLTIAGDLLGSPDYMAPEAARDAHNADIRGDIYSLGCVLFHALTGQVLFPDSNRVKQLVRHATEKPRPLKQFNIEVPDGLQQVMDIMLAKAPAQRFPTPDKAAKALKALLTGGADVVLVENEPRMRNYLDWLESQPTPPQPATEEYRPSQIDVVLEPVASPAPSPPPVPAARPARKRTAATPAAPAANAPAPRMGLSRRDLAMIGLGVGAVVLGIGYYSLYWFLTRNRKKPTATEDKDGKP